MGWTCADWWAGTREGQPCAGKAVTRLQQRAQDRPPHPGDTLSGGGSWEGGLEVKRGRRDERGPGSKASAPQIAAPELLSAKLPAPTALKSPLQFLPPSLGCAGAGEVRARLPQGRMEA